MIRYTLKCANDHRFESWFATADAFTQLQAAGHVACAFCGSTQVEKALMAPSVRPARKSAANPAPLSTAQTPAEETLAVMRRAVEENSDYVGLDFVAEARAMHEGNAPERAIHGEAKLEEARALLEEGIPVAPLPFMPKRSTN